MSLELESAYESLLFRNELPIQWRLLAFRSEANLRDFLKDLSKRVDFFSKWIEGSNNNKFWLKAFYLPQAFLTSVQLNYARSMTEVSTYCVKIHRNAYKITSEWVVRRLIA